MFTSTWLMTQDACSIIHIALVILATSYFILFPVDTHECFCSHAVRLKFHAVFHGNSLKALPHSTLEWVKFCSVCGTEWRTTEKQDEAARLMFNGLGGKAVQNYSLQGTIKLPPQNLI